MDLTCLVLLREELTILNDPAVIIILGSTFSESLDFFGHTVYLLSPKSIGLKLNSSKLSQFTLDMYALSKFQYFVEELILKIMKKYQVGH